MSRSLYKQLDANKIVETAERLHKRIVERFPASGLGEVAEEVCSVARASADRSARIARAYWSLRIGALVFTLSLFPFAANVLTRINFGHLVTRFSVFFKALNAGFVSI